MKATSTKSRFDKLLGAAGIMTAAAAATIVCPGTASAYSGPSFIQIPGIAGSWKGAQYTKWIKADGSYWNSGGGGGRGRGGFGRGTPTYSGPAGPASGEGKLAVGISKDNPALKKLMKACTSKTPITNMGFAENSALSRPYGEVGPRPAAMPEYYEYQLKDVTVDGCEVVNGAPLQAFILSFKNIERINYKGGPLPIEYKAPEPARLIPVSATTSGRSKSFVLSWFGYAHDVSDDQCPTIAAKPTLDDYYRLMPKEEADKERIANAKSGVSDTRMGFRGPMRLDIAKIPGIVADPGNPAPQTKIARGLNLDGDDGSGRPPAGIRKHVNYVSADGRTTGIDNQMYTVEGCIPGFQGRKGFFAQFANGQMRDGLLAIVMEVVGIDNDQNDDNIEVAFATSLDPMAKNAAGDDILGDYTFRLTDKPQFTHYFTRLKGRIENGVIVTDPVNKFSLYLGNFGTPNELILDSARLRLEILPNGRLKGLLGGYTDWRPIMSSYTGAAAETICNCQLPALYNAFRREADGMRDPVSGEYNGISVAYDIEGVPVFIQPPLQKIAQTATSPRPPEPAR